MVRPIYEYGIPIWYPDLKKHEREIEAIQRRATKMIVNLGHLSYSERIKSLKLPTLLYMRRRCDVIQMFKIIKRIDELDFDSFFSI